MAHIRDGGGNIYSTNGSGITTNALTGGIDESSQTAQVKIAKEQADTELSKNRSTSEQYGWDKILAETLHKSEQITGQQVPKEKHELLRKAV